MKFFVINFLIIAALPIAAGIAFLIGIRRGFRTNRKLS
jgi:hypothetical protein